MAPDETMTGVKDSWKLNEDTHEPNNRELIDVWLDNSDVGWLINDNGQPIKTVLTGTLYYFGLENGKTTTSEAETTNPKHFYGIFTANALSGKRNPRPVGASLQVGGGIGSGDRI